MSVRDVLVTVIAGLIGGAVNSGAGGGMLLTFPVLLGLGLTPLSANVTTTIAATTGYVGATIGQRPELQGQLTRIRRLSAPVIAGSLSGVGLLLLVPAAVFRTVVPGLICMACLALFLQPRLTQLAGGHGGEHSWRLRSCLFVAGAYGSYFGAAVGIVFLAVLSFAINDSFHRLNAVKVALAGLTSTIAALMFAVVAPVHWPAAVALGCGALVGGRLGSLLVHRVSASSLRMVVAVIGVIVAVKLALSGA